MRLAPSEEQTMIAETFARFLDAESSMARVRAALPTGFDPALWRGLAELGAFLLRVPESAGGLGLGILEAALLMEEAGRTLASGPLAEAIVAARLLAQLDPDDAAGLRDAVFAGEQVATIAMRDVACEPVQLVAGGAVAAAVIAREGDRIILVRPDGEERVSRSLASTPIARIDLRAGSRTVLAEGKEALALFAAAIEEWKMLVAAALAGLSTEAIRLGADYACQRIQFDRPIGTYQAVSHPLANAVIDVDVGRLMLWRAIRYTADGAPNAGETISAALWWAGGASEKAVAHALHIFGGYGLTLEYDIHLFNLRSRAWLLILGDPEGLLDEAARRRYGGEVAILPEAGEPEIEFGLGSDAEGLAAETRSLFERLMTPENRALAHYSFSGHVPSVHKAIAEAGLLFPQWPKRLGGREVSPYSIEAAHRVWREYGWTTHPYGTTNIIGRMMDRFGSDQLKEEVLSRVIAGESICSLGWTEPASGSDVFAARTKATQQPDGSWRMDGQKMFTSGADKADYVVLLTRTDPDLPKHKGITIFVVPLDAEGVTIQEVKTFQDERTNITYYDGVVVPDAYRLGEVNGGLAVLTMALELEQGTSFGSYHHAMVLAAERLCGQIERNGRPLLDEPQARRRLTRAAVHVLASECLHNRILWVSAEKRQNLAYGPACKLFSSEVYRTDSFDLLNLTAPESLMFDSPDAAYINQCYRHSQVCTVYGGTSEVQRSQVAERQLGLPRTR